MKATLWAATAASWIVGYAYAEMTLLGAYEWEHSHPQFGGFSGLEVAADGLSFTAINDRGTLFTGKIERDEQGITDITAVSTTGLKVKATDTPTDTEGLAIDAVGRIFVSLEGTARVALFETPQTAEKTLPRHADFAIMQPNSSLEALAIDAEGRLLTLPERSGRATRPFPVYEFDGTRWTMQFTLPRRGPYLPVGMDLGPDNQIYLLERDITGLGFRTRIRRFQRDGSGEETLLETRARTHDNLEGISVWQDEEGIRVSMISDDNFLFLQKTQIVEYRLTE